jgi:hypothetical protein
MSVNIEDALANLAAEELSGIRTDADNFAAKMAEQHDAVEASQQRIIDAMTNRRRPNQQPEYPDRVKAIANMLVAYPDMVPVFESITARFLAEMKASFERLAKQYTETTVPPEAQK